MNWRLLKCVLWGHEFVFNADPPIGPMRLSKAMLLEFRFCMRCRMVYWNWSFEHATPTEEAKDMAP